MYLANHMLGSQRNGLNHVGMNIGAINNRALGPVRDTEYPTYSDALLNWYQIKNVKSVRFMFTWKRFNERLEGRLPLTLSGAQIPQITSTIGRISKACSHACWREIST